MKIAVASQNRKAITGHAGKCRKFWVYEIENDAITTKILLELPIGQSFHASHGQPHPLDDVQVLITGSMGEGLMRRLSSRGIKGLITTELDPEKAVAAYLDGSLPLAVPDAHQHDHGNENHQCHCH
jgi:predicted Fe-Mo cluster-binding NifX family protein